MTPPPDFKKGDLIRQKLSNLIYFEDPVDLGIGQIVETDFQDDPESYLVLASWINLPEFDPGLWLWAHHLRKLRPLEALAAQLVDLPRGFVKPDA